MQEKTATVIGLSLPSYTIAVIALLISVSFVSYTVSSMIFIDKLILLTIGLSPIVFASGAVVSTIALVKCRNKAAAITGIVLNIAMLVGLSYFVRPFIMEFKLL